jgi:hypothetical protein
MSKIKTNDNVGEYSKWPFILTCIRCDCEIERLEGMPNNWDGAVDVSLQAHYGSKHDMILNMNPIKRAICDDCFDIVLNN